MEPLNSLLTFFPSLKRGISITLLWPRYLGNDLRSTLGVVFILAITSFCLHHLYINPLSKYPGPLLARVSGWPNWYHAARGDRHIWLLQLHSQYGSVVRFAPNSVAFNTISAVDSIYRARNANVKKGDWYEGVRDSAGGFESTFTARERARHNVKRRLLSHAFSSRAHQDYEPRVYGLVRKWLDCLQTAPRNEDGTLDFKDWINYLVFDILGDLCFGKAFGLLTSDQNRYVTTLLPHATGGWYSLGHNPYTHALRYLLFKTPIGPYVRSKARDDNAKFRDFCLAALVDRKRSGAEKSLDQRPEFCDIFYHLLTGTDPETGESYSMPDLACESVLLMVAGSHTTSTAIAAILFYLLNNPEKLAILSREIRTAFSHENEIRYRGDGKLADLPYLRACIDEGLRLTPPNPSHLPREVLPGGMKIDGHWFPAGVDVGVGSYAVQRSPTNYPDPGRFIPERWIQSNSRSLPPGLTAFSAGATGCIGKQLAYMEMHVVLAMLIHRFDLRAYPAAGAHAEYQMTDAFIGDGQGPRILLSVSSRI